MRALQLLEPNHVALRDIARPGPGEGEVLLKVLAAGVCQTDVHLRHAPGLIGAPGTVLGHEIAGEVVELGPGVTGVKPGERVVVHPCWSCGHCDACLAGRQNACRGTGSRFAPPPTPGVTRNGGIADYIAVPASSVVQIGELDPAVAAVLADAGLTPYHAVAAVRDRLAPGSSVVVIGVGGLGHLAVQMLKALTPARVMGVDINADALAAVGGLLDLALPSEDASIERIVEATRGAGADVVFDLVGTDATMKFAASVVAPYGDIRFIGLSCGCFGLQARADDATLPWGVTISRPYSGTYQDLRGVIALAQAGLIAPVVSRHGLDDAIPILDALEDGHVHGRAVLIPG